MGAIRITELATKLGVTVEQIQEVKRTKLEGGWKGTGKNTWFSSAAQDIVKLAFAIPLAVPAVLKAFGLHDANNHHYVFCSIAGVDGKKPVMIPLKLHGMLIGKEFNVHAITDCNGTTYRHVSLSR
jgi:hypothetical protein